MGKREGEYQSGLIERIKERFHPCLVLKNDPNYIQGIPDLTIFYKDKWALLECKKSSKEKKQPNQDYYVELADSMSFSRFIYPENEEEVLDELQQAFRA